MGKARKYRDNSPPIVTFDADGTMRVHSEDKDWVDFIHKCRDDEDGLELFCKFFLKASFKKPFTEHRRHFARNLSNPTLPFQWALASRSFGKTTLVWAELVRRMCFRLSRFVVYTSSELRLAERRTENVKVTLLTNPLIRRFFGAMNPQYVEGMREVFGSKSWKVVDPITNESFAIVVPKSDGATVNGLVEYVDGEQVRPDAIVCDDITDRKRVHDETYRERHIDWLYGTLFPCVENEWQPDPKTHRWSVKRGQRAPYQIMLIDTCKHSQAAVEVVAGDPEWTGKRYALGKAVDPDNTKFVSLVDYLSDEQIQQAYERFARIGKEDRFFREFLCVSGQSGDSKFPTSFQYYDDRQMDLDKRSDVIRFIIVDPARTQNPRSAYTAMLAVAVSVRTAQVWLRGMIHERMVYDDMGRNLFSFAKQMNTQILCVEDAGLHDAIRGPLQKYAMKVGMNPYWLWLPAARKFIEADDGERRSVKEARASSALWLYRPFGNTHPQGCVWHDESLRHGPLENQMLSYPECKGWDALDCLGYIDYVMTELGLVFDKQVTPIDNNYQRPVDPWDAILDDREWCCERYCA